MTGKSELRFTTVTYLNKYKFYLSAACLLWKMNSHLEAVLVEGAISADDGDDDVEIERLMAFYNDVWL